MKKVIEHGYTRYFGNCYKCKCYFEYTLDEVDVDGLVTCPDCCGKVAHNANNCDITSQIKTEDEPELNTNPAATDGDIKHAG